MTKKKAAFGNNFTPEQRAAALKRAAELRGARAEYLGRVKLGEVGIAAALAEAPIVKALGGADPLKVIARAPKLVNVVVKK